MSWAMSSSPRPGTRSSPLRSRDSARSMASSSAMMTTLRMSGSAGSTRATMSFFSASAIMESSSRRRMPRSSDISFCSILGLSCRSLSARTRALALPPFSSCSRRMTARRQRSRRAALLALSNRTSLASVCSVAASSALGSEASASASFSASFSTASTSAVSSTTSVVVSSSVSSFSNWDIMSPSCAVHGARLARPRAPCRIPQLRSSMSFVSLPLPGRPAPAD